MARARRLALFSSCTLLQERGATGRQWRQWKQVGHNWAGERGVPKAPKRLHSEPRNEPSNHAARACLGAISHTRALLPSLYTPLT